MSMLRKPTAKRKPSPRSSKAAFTAVCNLLFTGKSTRQENRVAVRHLLRQASRNLERSSEPR